MFIIFNENDYFNDRTGHKYNYIYRQRIKRHHRFLGPGSFGNEWNSLRNIYRNREEYRLRVTV